jgi:hypothetical protein
MKSLRDFSKNVLEQATIAVINAKIQQGETVGVPFQVCKLTVTAECESVRNLLAPLYSVINSDFKKSTIFVFHQFADRCFTPVCKCGKEGEELIHASPLEKIILCGECADNDKFDTHICPKCGAVFLSEYVSQNGRTPCCGYIFQDGNIKLTYNKLI